MADDITLDDFDSIIDNGQGEQVDEEAAYLDAVDASIQKQPQPQGPLAAQAAGEAMMIRGMPLEATEFHAAMMTGDAEAARQQAAQEHYNAEMLKVHEYIDSSILSGEVSPELVVNTAIAEQQRVQNRKQSPDAVQKAYMQQAAPNAAGSLKDEIAAHKQMLDVMQSLHASRGGWDTALDVVGSFWPFHTTKDFSDLVDLIEDDKDVSFIGGKDLETIAINFQSLNPATKAAIFPRLVELAKQASGTLVGDENIMQVTYMLSLFLGPTPDEGLAGARTLDTAVSVMDVPMGLALKGAVGVSKLAKGEKLLVKTVLEETGKVAAQTNNPVNLAAQAGDKARAAEYAIAAAKDPAIAESMNIRPQDAGRVGLLQPNMIDPKITEGMSAEMIQQIQKDSAEFGAFADSISTEAKFLRAGLITTSERQLSKESFYKQLEKTKEDYLTQNMLLEDVQLADTAEGFSYTLTWRRLDAAPIITPASNAAAPAVTTATRAELGATETGSAGAGGGGLTIVHGSGNPNLTLDAIEIVRTGQKQGKPGRSYGGLYGTREEDVAQAEKYASMQGGTPTLYNIQLKPGAKVLDKEGDITRISAKEIDKLKAEGYVAVRGKDPRGQVEVAVIDKDGVASFSKRSPTEAAPAPVKTLTPDEVRAADTALKQSTKDWYFADRNASGRWQEGEMTANPSFKAATGGETIPAHGMTKARTLTAAVEDLSKILDEGFDASRTLYTAPITAKPGGGAGVGTASGTATRDGPFILVFKEGTQGAHVDNISSVLVNPANAEIIPLLQKRFPNTTFRTYDDVQGAINQAKTGGAGATTQQVASVMGAEAVAKAAAEASDSIVVAHANVTKTPTAVIIEGEHEAVAAALKAAGLPTGAQNKVRGNSYTSLAPHLHDQVVAALADAGGMHRGAKGANASEAAKTRAVEQQVAAQTEARAATAAEQGAPVQAGPVTPEMQQAAVAEIEAKSPKYLKESGEVVMTRDDYTGNYNLTVASLEKGTLASHALSPTAWMKGERATEDGIRAATDEIVAKEVEAGITAHVTSMLQKAFAPVAGLKNIKARQRLAAVLEHGDTFVNPGSAERGRTFTVQELADGFDIPGQKGRVRLTSPEEVTAYYRVRMFEDAMYQAENHAMRRRLQLEGMQQIKSLAGVHVGKVFNKQSARALIEGNPGSVFFKADTGELVEARLDTLDKHLEDGYEVVRTRDPVNTSGTADGDETALYTDFLLVKKQGISDLPAQVLHYREGYVTKINKAQYMVKRVYNVNKPGSPGTTGTMAMRGFNSLKDAETFRYEQITKYLQDNPNATYEQAKAKFTIGGADEEGAFAATERGSGRTGGLFTGMRSKNDLVFGLSGSDMKRVGLQETLMRQTAHIGKLVSRNELRLRNETVWLNTVREQLPDVRIVGFEGTKLPSNSTGKALERIRDQIRQWNGVPDVDETKMQAAIQYLHDWALTGVRKLGMHKDSIDSLLWLKHSNPVTAVKTAMMHTLLGCMAPVQMYVQGSAALVAAGRRAGISLTGDVGGDIKVAMQFAMLDNIQHEGALGRVMNTLMSKKEINPLVAEAYQAFRRTGLLEGATANPDLAKIAADGLGITNGVLSNLSNMSLYFYRTGELFNRRYSFIKEFAAWKQLNPGKTAGEEDIIGILKEANKNMLELNAANRAWWQGGAGTGMVRQIMGMATQFLQVNAKMAELLLPQQITGRAATAGFTTAQKARIIASQMALFGSAGIPLGNAAIGQLFNIMGVEEMPPEAALAVNQGFVGFTVNAMLGNAGDPTQQIDISQRAAIGNQVNQFLQDVYTSDDPIWLKMLGPAGGSAGSRFLQAARDARVFYLGNKAAEIEGVNGETLIGVIQTYGAVLATMPSSTSNLLKAYYMHNFDKLLARNRKTIDARQYDFGTEMAVAFGFTPSIESTTRAIEATNRNYEELVGAQAEMYIRVLHRAVFEQKMKPESVEHLIKVLAAQDAISDNPVMHLDIMQRVGSRLFSEPQTMHDRALSTYFKHDVVGHATQEAIADIEGVIPQSAVVQPYYKKAQER